MVQHEQAHPVSAHNKVAVLYAPSVLQRVCKQLAQQIQHDYRHRHLVMVVVLKGAAVFAADLVRHLTMAFDLDFITIASYGTQTKVTGNQVKLLHGLRTTLKNRDVLIVDDIIDTGYSLKFLEKLLLKQHPRSLKSCFLLDKPHRRKVAVQGDYVGIKVPDKFIVGYGIDYAGHYRNLPYIGCLDT